MNINISMNWKHPHRLAWPFWGAFRNGDLASSRSLGIDLWMSDPAPRACSPASWFVWYEQLPSVLVSMWWPCLPYYHLKPWAKINLVSFWYCGHSCVKVTQANDMAFSYWYCIDSLNVRNTPYRYMMLMVGKPECRICNLLWNNSINPKLFIVK